MCSKINFCLPYRCLGRNGSRIRTKPATPTAVSINRYQVEEQPEDRHQKAQIKSERERTKSDIERGRGLIVRFGGRGKG